MPFATELSPFAQCLTRQQAGDRCQRFADCGKTCPDCPMHDYDRFEDTFPTDPVPLDAIAHHPQPRSRKGPSRRRPQRVGYIYKAFLFSAFVVGLLMVAVAFMPH